MSVQLHASDGAALERAIAIQHFPEQMKNLGDYLPDDYEERIARFHISAHPEFADLNISLGLCARSMVESGFGPIIALGILDKDGELGRLGAGIYDMPVHPFADAMLKPGGSAE